MLRHCPEPYPAGIPHRMIWPEIVSHIFFSLAMADTILARALARSATRDSSLVWANHSKNRWTPCLVFASSRQFTMKTNCTFCMLSATKTPKGALTTVASGKPKSFVACVSVALVEPRMCTGPPRCLFWRTRDSSWSCRKGWPTNSFAGPTDIAAGIASGTNTMSEPASFTMRCSPSSTEPARWRIESRSTRRISARRARKSKRLQSSAWPL